jgi:outer membrane protein W
MKMTMRFSMVVLLAVSTIGAYAKSRSRGEEEAAPKGWHFTVSSVGAGQSYYTPDLGYWNMTSQIRLWDTKFNQMRLWGANAEFGIYNNFHLRAEGSYGTVKAKQTVVPVELGGGTQSKSIDLIPLTAIVLYEFSDGDVKPYLGAGAGSVFVSSANELSQQSGVITGKSNSTDYMYYAVGGVKLPAMKNLFVGVEARGAFGSYQEMVKDTHQVSSLQKISLNGFQVGVSVNYKF